MKYTVYHSKLKFNCQQLKIKNKNLKIWGYFYTCSHQTDKNKNLKFWGYFYTCSHQTDIYNII